MCAVASRPSGVGSAFATVVWLWECTIASVYRQKYDRLRVQPNCNRLSTTTKPSKVYPNAGDYARSTGTC